MTTAKWEDIHPQIKEDVIENLEKSYQSSLKDGWFSLGKRGIPLGAGLRVAADRLIGRDGSVERWNLVENDCKAYVSATLVRYVTSKGTVEELHGVPSAKPWTDRVDMFREGCIAALEELTGDRITLNYEPPGPSREAWNLWVRLGSAGRKVVGEVLHREREETDGVVRFALGVAMAALTPLGVDDSDT